MFLGLWWKCSTFGFFYTQINFEMLLRQYFSSFRFVVKSRDHVYDPLLLIFAYTLLTPYAVYVVLKKPLTYHVSTFTVLAIAVILYTIRITAFPSRCPSNVGVYIPGHAPDNNFEGTHPDARLQSPPPPVAPVSQHPSNIPR